MVSDYQAFLIQTMYDIREQILEERPIITKSELDDLILDAINNKGIADGPVKKDLLKLFNDTDKKISEAREKFAEDLSKVEEDAYNETLTTKTKKASKRKVKNAK